MGNQGYGRRRGLLPAAEAKAGVAFRRQTSLFVQGHLVPYRCSLQRTRVISISARISSK
jgi:hypothetical protein